MFDTILIANRGEIACRIIRTARRMGIRTVAVFSEADAGALHTTLADIAVPIGPAPARDSYLDIQKIIAAAHLTNAQAIHPGYGFLSENAAFADACTDAHITFIGPPASAIRAMGSKSAAKSAMEHAQVPLVPGYHGENQDPALLAREAARIGYPVLIKASAGGGGKGMRVVTTPDDFAENLALAKSEASSAFNDDQVLVERYLTRPRHIEIQVFADTHGHTISLFERDCSIQRRHQKVVEEAPAPGMTPERRAAMGQAACDAARAIGYVGAGTVEFIAEDDRFYFMEMNTRLQVEHPVTEMITGLDLVEWQLRVASGEPLPTTTPHLHGHAIEVRIYAEDPARDFMPATGRLLHLRPPAEPPPAETPPAETQHVRVDTGVREGDVITVHYDPMIAKLIVWDETRDAALRHLRQALAAYEAVGVATNLPLLRRIAAHPAFARGGVDTGFIPRHEPELLPPQTPAPNAAIFAAAAHALATPPLTSPQSTLADPHSPWSTPHTWRMNAPAHRTILVQDHDTTHEIQVAYEPGNTTRLTLGPDHALLTDNTLLHNGLALTPRIITDPAHPQTLQILLDATPHRLLLPDPLAPPEATPDHTARITAPMPGRIIAVHATPGQHVHRNDVLLILEAMKVQMRIAAPRDGTIATIHPAPGDLVDEGTELATYAPEADAG